MSKMEKCYININKKFSDIAIELYNLWKYEKTHERYLNPTDNKFIRFVKEIDSAKEGKADLVSIETVFTQIDEMAEENRIKIGKSKASKAPGQEITQNNCYRVSYGDLNYLGNNRAIFYFDRGVRGPQTYTNSMHSGKMQPSFKDIVVIDDIVFTANCKYDSSKQHKEIFPHYRVTIAAGITCPVRLSTMERIIFARNKNASKQSFMSARQF